MGTVLLVNSIGMSFLNKSSLLVFFLSLFSPPIDAAALPDAFTATISGMDCSLYLVMGKGRNVRKRKSEVECFTTHSVEVESALVINDITAHIFNITLRVESNEVKQQSNLVKAKIIKGRLLPNPEDLTMASKQIQHQGPSHELRDRGKLIGRLLTDTAILSSKEQETCIYKRRAVVPWSPCQRNNVSFKVLRLNKWKSTKGCFKYRTLNKKCRESQQRRRWKDVSHMEIANEIIQEKASDLEISGYRILHPIDENIISLLENSTDIMEEEEEDDDIITSQRNAILERTWPDRTLVYEFNENVDSGDRQIIRNGVNLLKDSLGHCINFEERDHGSRVMVYNSVDRCSADAGYYGWETPQSLKLAPGCYKRWTGVFYGTVQHEFLHALGLHHEHCRDDRDFYITINKDNIKPGRKHNFFTCSEKHEICSTFDEPYDYLSVMHYRSGAFSIGDTSTITVKNKTIIDDKKLGQRVEPTLGDARRVQFLYNCPVVIQWKGKWGDFTGSPVFCPSGSFVHGYQVEGLPDQGDGDDTALTGLQLHCEEPGSFTTSKTLKSKAWDREGIYVSKTKWCDNPVVGFDVRSVGGQGAGDDTGVNAVDLYCNPEDYISAEVKIKMGTWSNREFCPPGYAVVGLRTQHGKDFDYSVPDDVGLTGVELYCDRLH